MTARGEVTGPSSGEQKKENRLKSHDMSPGKTMEGGVSSDCARRRERSPDGSTDPNRRGPLGGPVQENLREGNPKKGLDRTRRVDNNHKVAAVTRDQGKCGEQMGGRPLTNEATAPGAKKRSSQCAGKKKDIHSMIRVRGVVQKNP